MCVKVVFSSLHITQVFSFQCNMSLFVGIQTGDTFLAKKNSIKVSAHKFKTMAQLRYEITFILVFKSLCCYSHEM